MRSCQRQLRQKARRLMAMSVSCGSLFRFSGWKLAVLVVFVLVNILLYACSKYNIMETTPHQLGSNVSMSFLQGLNNIGRQYHMWHRAPSINDWHMVRPLDKRRVMMSRGNMQHEKIVNPHNFKYLIKPNISCSNRVVELAICAVVSRDNELGRTVIRNTWGSYANNWNHNAILVFFIGSGDKDMGNNSDTDSKLLEEASIYGDILQEDYIDSYQNLSLKSVSILKWVSLFCSSAKFVLKADDDMYVNIPFLIKILREHAALEDTPSAFVMGSMQIGAQPLRDPSSKWYTSYDMYNKSTYPKYVSGTAYAMTAEAAYLLYEASLRVPNFWLEDIYITGLCSKFASVTLYDSAYFSYSKPVATGCAFRNHVSGHRYNYQEILKIHTELYDPNVKCWQWL